MMKKRAYFRTTFSYCLEVVSLICFIIRRSDCIDKKYKFNESTGENLPMIEVPVWEKSNLTLEEAAAYSGIGINKLRKLSDTETCPFVLWIGSKRLIKRRKLDEYTDRMYSL